MFSKVLLVLLLITIHSYSIDALSKYFHPNGTVVKKSELYYSDGTRMTRKQWGPLDPVTGKRTIIELPPAKEYDEDDYDDEGDYISSEEDIMETSSTWKPVDTTTEEPEATSARWTTRPYVTTQKTFAIKNKKLNNGMKFSTIEEAVQAGIWIIIIVVSIFVLCCIFCMISSCCGSEPKKVNRNQLYV